MVTKQQPITRQTLKE